MEEEGELAWGLDSEWVKGQGEELNSSPGPLLYSQLHSLLQHTLVTFGEVGAQNPCSWRAQIQGGNQTPSK